MRFAPVFYESATLVITEIRMFFSVSQVLCIRLHKTNISGCSSFCFWSRAEKFSREYPPSPDTTLTWSRIHEHTISLRFRGIILRVPKLEVSVYNVYITNQFKTTCSRGGVKSVGRGDFELQGGKLFNTFFPGYVQESASGEISWGGGGGGGGLIWNCNCPLLLPLPFNRYVRTIIYLLV